jgi:hypothetical protein
MRHAILVLALSVGWLSLSPADSPGDGSHGNASGLPRLMLWAWERPTDLRDLESDVGVAFYAQTIRVVDGRASIQPRRNPLRVSEDTPLVAVSRIETDADTAMGFRDTLVDEVAAAIVRTASLPRVVGVQLDFDALTSERPAYRQLVGVVRIRLRPDVPLSMTALASWCANDRWLDTMPVDEVIPMLFRMGPVNRPYAHIARSSSAAAPACRGAIGTSLDEPLRILAHGRRLYVFNSGPWTDTSIARAQGLLE